MPGKVQFSGLNWNEIRLSTSELTLHSLNVYLVGSQKKDWGEKKYIWGYGPKNNLYQ